MFACLLFLAAVLEAVWLLLTVPGACVSRLLARFSSWAELEYLLADVAEKIRRRP